MTLYSNFPFLTCGSTMTYTDMPLIIPLLATGYLLTIYLLLSLAQRTAKGGRSVASQRSSLPYSTLTVPAPRERLDGTGTPQAYKKPPEVHLTEALPPTRYSS
jgi:hypothetical protein